MGGSAFYSQQSWSPSYMEGSVTELYGRVDTELYGRVGTELYGRIGH